MKTKIINAHIFSPEDLGKQTVYIEDNLILDITPCADGIAADSVIDASGLYAVPGFLDIHVHGGGGKCCMEGTAEAVITMANAHAQYGTTTILPTAWTAPIQDILAAIEAVKQAQRLDCDATVAGIHLEGPYLSPEQAGAQLPGALQIPARSDWKALVGCWEGIKMVGMAPELPGALEMARWLKERGTVASVAHSNAFEAEMRLAVENGFSDVTHIYSGCSTFKRENGFRIPGVVECGLAWDQLTAQVIADGKHLPDTVLHLIWKAKGTDNMILITDGLDFAGCQLAEGQTYIQQNGMEVVYEDGVMKLPHRQAFAGSVATADRLLRVAVNAGIPFRDALKMLTVNPAKRIGLDGTKGRLKKGYDADIVLLDKQLQVVGCVAKGKIIRLEQGRRI